MNEETVPQSIWHRCRRVSRRIAPALGLFFLAPLVGEYLHGSVSITEITGVVFLASIYGGAALIIREVTRRTGRGWPTIILLGWAWGVFQAGLIDQSLFNPSYLSGSVWQALRGPTYVPVLGISAYTALGFTVGHAIWSISVPVAIVETFVPDRREIPWLGNVGLAVTSVVFLLGSALIFYELQETKRFLASVPQLIGAAAVVVILIGIGFAIGRRSDSTVDQQAPNPWLVGTVALIVLSMFNHLPIDWLGVIVSVVLLAAMAVLVARWSRRSGWSDAHRLALASGALLTYVWLSFTFGPTGSSQSAVDLIGNVIFGLGAVLLLTAAARKVDRP